MLQTALKGYPQLMTASITDIRKGRGRPATGGRKPGVLVRLPEAELAALDEWIAQQPEPTSRPRAIRRLVDAALKAMPSRAHGNP